MNISDHHSFYYRHCGDGKPRRTVTIVGKVRLSDQQQDQALRSFLTAEQIYEINDRFHREHCELGMARFFICFN
jgi:hypothetical protein